MKSPGLAAFLTLLFPGLGQLYCGRWVRGFCCAAGAIAARVLGVWLDAALKVRIFSGLLGPGSYLLIAWDAYACAASASAEAETRGEPEAPSRLLLWSWVGLRAALLVSALLLCLSLLFAAAASAYRFRIFALSSLASVLGAGFGAWLAIGGLKRTYRAARGEELVSAESMTEWIGAISALALVAGVLVAIVLPEFSGLFRKSAEGRVKGDLASLRAAVEDYRKTNGSYPLRLEQAARAGAMAEIPTLWPSSSGVPHEPSREVVIRGARGSGDSGHWGYVADKSAPDFGRVYVDCSHTDTRGSAWSSY